MGSQCGVRLGGVVTYFAYRTVPQYKRWSSLAPENVFLSVSLCLCYLYSLHREVHSENAFYAKICTKSVQTLMLTVQVVRRCVFMVRMGGFDFNKRPFP